MTIQATRVDRNIRLTISNNEGKTWINLLKTKGNDHGSPHRELREVFSCTPDGAFEVDLEQHFSDGGWKEEYLVLRNPNFKEVAIAQQDMTSAQLSDLFGIFRRQEIAAIVKEGVLPVFNSFVSGLIGTIGDFGKKLDHMQFCWQERERLLGCAQNLMASAEERWGELGKALGIKPEQPQS